MCTSVLLSLCSLPPRVSGVSPVLSLPVGVGGPASGVGCRVWVRSLLLGHSPSVWDTVASVGCRAQRCPGLQLGPSARPWQPAAVGRSFIPVLMNYAFAPNPISSSSSLSQSPIFCQQARKHNWIRLATSCPAEVVVEPRWASREHAGPSLSPVEACTPVSMEPRPVSA